MFARVLVTPLELVFSSKFCKSLRIFDFIDFETNPSSQKPLTGKVLKILQLLAVSTNKIHAKITQEQWDKFYNTETRNILLLNVKSYIKSLKLFTTRLTITSMTYQNIGFIQKFTNNLLVI